MYFPSGFIYLSVFKNLSLCKKGDTIASSHTNEKEEAADRGQLFTGDPIFPYFPGATPIEMV